MAQSNKAMKLTSLSAAPGLNGETGVGGGAASYPRRRETAGTGSQLIASVGRTETGLQLYTFSRSELDRVYRRARRAAVNGGREICGLIVRHANGLGLVELRNKVKRGGSFAFYAAEARSAVAAAEKRGGAVVGTFHSHPYYGPDPGPSDIANALDDSLMLVIDALYPRVTARLWHIHRGHAVKVQFRRRDA